MPETRVNNTSIVLATNILQANLNAFLEEEARAIAALKAQVADAINLANKKQSAVIAAGYIPDDSRDFLSVVEDLTNDIIANLEVLTQVAKDSKVSVDSVVNNAKTLRLDMDQVTPQ